MEELGDGFSFVFVGCGVFGCCLTHVLGTWCCELIWTWFGRWFVGFCELEKPLNLFSTFQRFVNNWHFHHVHVWTICQQCRMPTNFNICNNVTWNDMNHFWGTIVSFTFFSTCGRIFLWTLIWCCHQPTPSAHLNTRTWQGPVLKDANHSLKKHNPKIRKQFLKTTRTFHARFVVWFTFL